MTGLDSMVASRFFPSQASELAFHIQGFLGEVESVPNPRGTLRILIAPHSGYMDSAIVAAHAYACIAPHKIQRVAILGPSHRVQFQGMAIPKSLAYSIPGTTFPIDVQTARALRVHPLVQVDDRPFHAEHSIEAQLPFLAMRLGPVPIIPVVIGNCNHQDITPILNYLLEDPTTLIVLSSDLCHFLDYQHAIEQDQKTCQRILEGTVDFSHQEACGHVLLNALGTIRSRLELNGHQLFACNSADTGGASRHQVTGYASFGFWAPPKEPDFMAF